MFTDYFTHTQQFAENWKKMAGEPMKQFEEVIANINTMQEQSVERASDAIDGSAKLVKDSLRYSQELTQQWRKLSLDASKRAAEMMTPKF